MPDLDHITRSPQINRPCLRGMRVTVGTIVRLVAAAHSDAEILNAYACLEEEDIRQSLAYARNRPRFIVRTDPTTVRKAW